MKLNETLWMPFKDAWLRFHKTRTGQSFTFKTTVGNCARVADLYRQYLKNGVSRYGFFTGEVTHPRWFVDGKPKAVQRHGWLRLKDVILDPTRWCFLKEEKPLLCVTPCSSADYDEGMSAAKRFLFDKKLERMPSFTGKSVVECDQPEILWLCGGNGDISRLHWLGHQSPESPVFSDEEECLRIFDWMEKHGYGAFIPWDFNE